MKKNKTNIINKQNLKKNIIIQLFLIFLLATSTCYAAVSREEAYKQLYSAKKSVSELESLGYSTARLNDLLNEAEADYASTEYSKVVTLSNSIKTLKLKAIELNEDIEILEHSIRDGKLINLSYSNAESLLNTAKLEFESDSYELAESSIDKAYEKLAEENKEEFASISPRLNSLKEQSGKNGLQILKINENILEYEDQRKVKDYRKLILILKDIENIEDTIPALIKAKADIQELMDMGLSTVRVNDVLKEALFSLESSDFSKTIQLCNEISDLKNQAVMINLELQQTDNKLNDLKSKILDVTAPELLLKQAKEKFEIDNYEDAYDLLTESNDRLEYIEAQSLIFGVISKNELKLSMTNYFRKYWPIIVVFTLVALIFSIIFYRQVSKIILRLRIINLKREESNLVDLIKQSQRDYYKDKTISKQTYYIRTDKYHERRVKIKEKLPVLRNKLEGKRKERKKTK